jgi:carbon storage regulator
MAMLVLSRRVNESIVINNTITVTVVEIRTDKVRLGIVHPREVSVHRQEVFDLLGNTTKTHSVASSTSNSTGVVDARPNPILSSVGFTIQHTLKFNRTAPEARRVIDFAAGMKKEVPNADEIEISFTPEEWTRLLAQFEPR